MIGMEPRAHTEATAALSKELAIAINKFGNTISPIEVTAMLADFAGQSGANASVYQDFATDEVIATIARNSSAAYDRQLDKLNVGAVCNCPACLAAATKVAGKPN